jgi:CDGSH-type Zn-finger protein/truncated hemoglobin YjbI
MSGRGRAGAGLGDGHANALIVHTLRKPTIRTVSMEAHDESKAWSEGSDTVTATGPVITVTEHGPYQVVGAVEIYGAEGTLLRRSGTWCLCRCGGSRNKPFCDATHAVKGFDGTESADHDAIANRRDRYVAEGITVFDDRTRCAHFGQCTNRLPAVFRADAEPFVDPHGADADAIADVVAGCPSGALAYARGTDGDPVETGAAEPSITPIVDGPYRVRGPVQVVGADGRAYERRERQTLCRCGQSNNKPFCDGSHWYAGFRDPVPPELATHPPSLYDWAGGLAALERLTAHFYDAIVSEPDPILEPVFRGMDPDHPRHVAAWLAETFGGPTTYTEELGGYEHMLAKHRNLALTETQRRRWVSRMLDAADDVGLPADPGFRSTFVAYLEWGTRLAVTNSQPEATVMEHAPVPHWGWGQTPPYQPQPWDHADAAEQGRRRYAQQQHRRQPTPKVDRSEQ